MSSPKLVKSPSGDSYTIDGISPAIEIHKNDYRGFNVCYRGSFACARPGPYGYSTFDRRRDAVQFAQFLAATLGNDRLDTMPHDGSDPPTKEQRDAIMGELERILKGERA